MTDADGIEAIATLIRAQHLFAAVDSGIFTSGLDPTATATPYCWVRPARWSVEKYDGDDTDPVRSRIVHFEIEVQTRPKEGRPPGELASAVEAAVHGAFLAPASTSCTCEAGTYHKFGGTNSPQHRLTLTGTFTYDL